MMKHKSSSPSVSSARRAAFEVLLRVEAESAFASVLLARFSESDFSREDRALAQEIVLGVLRWKRSLDYFIERYSRRPIARLDLPVLIALRIGLYQLRHLTRIPRSAAVNESVNLVKQARSSSAAGLVNAVLRKAAGHLGEQPGETITDPIERASVRLSHPRWMIERWQAWMGEDETASLARANNSPAPTAFRVNSLRTTVAQALAELANEKITTRESAIAPGAFVVESRSPGVLNRAAERGLIYLQDEASQLVSTLLEPRPGDRVLDLCAAPGSKSSHIAGLAQDKAWIIASDLYTHRLDSLKAASNRLGVTSIDPVALDATQPLPFIESAIAFDRVLVDAPCSGTGTLRGNPEIKWRLSLDDIRRLAELQASLLERAASSVARGGRIVYSTCSIEREENEDVVSRFLESNPRFQSISPGAREDLVTSERFVRTFPHKQGSDGFFAAVIERVR